MINMGVPVLIGVGQQASGGGGGSKSLTISTITITTAQYGTTTSAGLVSIDPSQQITTVLNSGNSFTVPTDGLAQYYSNSDPAQQVLHTMRIQYTTSDFTSSDMGRQAIYQTTLNNSPSTSQLLSWVTEANPMSDAGQFLPAGGGAGQGVTISTLPLEGSPSDFFEQAPTLGESSIALLNAPDGFVVNTSKGNTPIEVERVLFCPFAAQNLGSSSSFDIKLKILLKDGTFGEGTQTITIPAGAVKDNLTTVVQPTVTQLQTQALISTPFESDFPQTPLDPSQQLICTVNTGEVADTQSMIFQTSGTTSASHSFRLRFDTTGLTASDFPEEMQVRYVITSAGYGASEIGWIQEDLFSQTCLFDGQDRSAIITGGLVFGPVALLDNDAQFKITTDLNGTTWQVRVELQKNDGSFLASPEFDIVMASDTVINL